jgi:hypothetical protein
MIRVRKSDDQYAKFSGRPWTVIGVPGEGRTSYYPSWEAAMDWATMPPHLQLEQIEYDAQFEMGQ